jgi:DNA-binding MarR family transcriptional regulator
VVIMADGPESQRVGSRYLSVAYRVRKVLDERMIASGLSLARAKVLQVLAENGSLRQSSLAEELGFAQRTVTQAVEALARDGLVERTSDPIDGRAKLVTLTDAGTAALAASTDAGDKVLEGIFGTLDRQQLASLDDVLKAVEIAATRAGSSTFG